MHIHIASAILPLARIYPFAQHGLCLAVVVFVQLPSKNKTPSEQDWITAHGRSSPPYLLSPGIASDRSVLSVVKEAFEAESLPLVEASAARNSCCSSAHCLLFECLWQAAAFQPRRWAAFQWWLWFASVIAFSCCVLRVRSVAKSSSIFWCLLSAKSVEMFWGVILFW